MPITVDEVETAIRDILTQGVTVTVDDITYGRADLGALRKLHDQLKAEQPDPNTGRAYYGRTCGGAR